MNFSQHQERQVHEQIGEFVPNNGMQLDLDQQINEIVRESFKTTKKYIWKGVFCFLFYFAALYTLKDGVLPIMAQTFPGTETTMTPDTTTKNNPSKFFPPIDDTVPNDDKSENLEDGIDANVIDEGKEEDSIGDLVNDEANEVEEEPLDTSETVPEEDDTEIAEEAAETKEREAILQEDEIDEELTKKEEHVYTPSIFHCLFPLFGLAYHQQLGIVHNKKEHIVFFVLKLAIFAGFLVIIFYTWASQQMTMLITTGTCLIIIPIVSIIYSYTIFNMKCMASGRDGANNANLNQGGHAADAAELDPRQEVVIREFQERHQNVQANFDNQMFGLGLAEAGEELVEFDGNVANHRPNQ